MQTDLYFRTLVLPTGCPELFADFLLDFTQEAIEEGCASDLLDLSYQYFGDGCARSLPSKTYIVYSSQEPGALIKGLEEFCQCLAKRGAHVGFYHYTSAHPNLDWIESYKRSITPVACGKFYITPSWMATPKDMRGLHILRVDPSLAFGTGHHESTRMLLGMFSVLPESAVQGKLALDVGCGSGILSLALAKLGARVHLCDVDALAIREAHKNFARNGLQMERIWQGSVEATATAYDLIAINIVAEIILELYGRVLWASCVGTRLFLSGILDKYEDVVLGVYTQGFELLERKQENEWVSLDLRKTN